MIDFAYYRPTLNLRMAIWLLSGSSGGSSQTIQRLQQEWVSDIEGMEPVWRNVPNYFMPYQTIAESQE